MITLPLLALAARLLLAGVFLTAGVTKLIDRTGSRKSLIDFGAPDWLATPGGILLPVAELLAAVLLLPASSSVYGALAAAALLAVFVAAIGFNLARGRRPDCHCFGQVHSQPIGRPLLIRNGALLLAAAFVIVVEGSGSRISLVAWMEPLTPMERVTAIGGTMVLLLMATQLALLTEVYRQNARLRAFDDPAPDSSAMPPALADPLPPAPDAQTLKALAEAGHPIGSIAPVFVLPTPDGDIVTLRDLLGLGKPVVLVFSDADCGPCSFLMPEVGRWQREFTDVLTVAVVSRGTAEANRKKAAEHGLTRVVLQKDHEIDQAYAVFGMPSAVLVLLDGTIGSRLAQGEFEIKPFVEYLAKEWEGRLVTPSSNPDPPDAPNVPVDPVKATRPPVGPLAADAKPVKHSCIEDELLPDGSMVLYSSCTRLVLTLNPTAALIWECCDGEHDVDAMAAELVDVFPGTPRLTEHVAEVLDQLLTSGMIARERPTDAAAAGAAPSNGPGAD